MEKIAENAAQYDQTRGYRDLIVWQKSIELVTEVYELTREFPKEEIYGLQSQIRRAAVSVASNIAEGQGRAAKADFGRFLRMSLGSLAEIDTQLEIAKRLGYLPDKQTAKAETLAIEVRKMLSGLLNSLK